MPRLKKGEAPKIVTAQQLIDVLVELTQRYGDLPVIVYHNEFIRFKIGSVGACTNRDHILITTGESDQDN